jgi:hypothetical protein
LGTTSFRNSNQKREIWANTRPLYWDASREHIVESRYTVGGHEEQAVIIQFVNVANLATGVEFEFRDVGCEQNGAEELGCHEEILQVKIVAYSNLTEIFVNGFAGPSVGGFLRLSDDPEALLGID